MIMVLPCCINNCVNKVGFFFHFFNKYFGEIVIKIMPITMRKQYKKTGTFMLNIL